MTTGTVLEAATELKGPPTRSLKMEENAVILFSTEMLLRLFGMLLTIVVARASGLPTLAS